ncbi:alpha-amylase family protein [Candidatus Xianfuyuplasma coldseepsis]|uniref:Alpha-amylase n=1 Tax=Candidatus Xianfuyuplasma coldseepsis TaxID=2782163 RepID=A0A7L7KQD6_9MOLU|nr:alpha-amylase family protein [Xianfuyuplasma coldseepsis]QMS84795.1 alpha-amylase [Xianfuyuplasma coldseepsis]
MKSLYSKRLSKHQKELKQLYFKLYDSYGATPKDFDSLLSMMFERYNERSDRLNNLDQHHKTWYLSRKLVGYTLYVDLFSDTLRKLEKKIPYLQELGITFVHLMPLLQTPEGENDGGYAVEDYLEINPSLGTMDDFEHLIEQFADANIVICIDYVINHTSDTHEWARKALNGDSQYQDMYLMYDDRTIPDQFDQTVPLVLPNKRPSNFTYKEEINKWVYTSFSSFQWDLNFKNPLVFEEMVNILLQLANKGINMIRLDAIPFMWKELHTSCRNLPEVHDLLHLFHLIKEIVCPSLVLLGEAIVEPDEIFKYFGTEERNECSVLYNANLMVNIWNAFATRDVRLLNIDNSKYHIHDQGCWMNYVRCHDDIGWGLNESALESLGVSPYYHKQYLIEFYSNQFPGSFAKGEIYQFNPQNNDARINGTTASLLGLERSYDEHNEYEQYIALRRIFLAHAILFSHRGIPLIYSGDEIATINDQSYRSDDRKNEDGRWVHRPYFDWTRAKKRLTPKTFESIVFNAIKNMITIRKKHSVFDGDVQSTIIINNDISLYSFVKATAKERILFIYNFSEYRKELTSEPYQEFQFSTNMEDLFTGRTIDFNHPSITISPYEVLWLMEKL